MWINKNYSQCIFRLDHFFLMVPEERYYYLSVDSDTTQSIFVTVICHTVLSIHKVLKPLIKRTTECGHRSYKNECYVQQIFLTLLAKWKTWKNKQTKNVHGSKAGKQTFLVLCFSKPTTSSAFCILLISTLWSSLSWVSSLWWLPTSSLTWTS